MSVVYVSLIDESKLRLGKVTSGLAVGIWVGFGLTLGLEKTSWK